MDLKALQTVWSCHQRVLLSAHLLLTPQGATQGLEFEEAAKRFWILDANGLITKHRPAEQLSDVQRPFAAIGEDDKEGESLLDVVKRVSAPSFFAGHPSTEMACANRTDVSNLCCHEGQ